jgi:hypothetical protein
MVGVAIADRYPPLAIDARPIVVAAWGIITKSGNRFSESGARNMPAIFGYSDAAIGARYAWHKTP